MLSRERLTCAVGVRQLRHGGRVGRHVPDLPGQPVVEGNFDGDPEGRAGYWLVGQGPLLVTQQADEAHTVRRQAAGPQQGIDSALGR